MSYSNINGGCHKKCFLPPREPFYPTILLFSRPSILRFVFPHSHSQSFNATLRSLSITSTFILSLCRIRTSIRSYVRRNSHRQDRLLVPPCWSLYLCTRRTILHSRILQWIFSTPSFIRHFYISFTFLPALLKITIAPCPVTTTMSKNSQNLT